MSEIIRVLIVEDQIAEQEAWRNVIELHNSDSEAVQVNPQFAASLAEAESCLSKERYDAAIVDIRLDQPGVTEPNSDGNEVIRRICEMGLMVVAALTGESKLVDLENIKVFTKGSADVGDGTDAALKWLLEQAPLISAVRSAHDLIQQQLAVLFHHSVWPRWKRWVEKGTDGGVELPLARHLISHVHATLLEKQGHRVHPEEWYFIPPVREGIRTGDVVRTSNAGFEIVVSPRCDLSEKSAVTHILFAKCTCVVTEWNELVGKVDAGQNELNRANSGNRSGAEKTLRKAQEDLRRFTQHNKNTNAVHFLPQACLEDGTEFGPVLVNFDQIRSVEKESVEAKELQKKRVAAISPEFLPSLVERLGSYLSRIGSPDYSHPAG